MKNEHGKRDVKTYFKGASPDLDKEFLGGQSNGEYIDARNMIPTTIDGKTGSSNKIKGEVLNYSNSNLSADYISLGVISLNNHLVELWASTNPLEADSIRIDGQVMVQSDDLLFDINFPFQFDTNEQCGEGEFFITDNKNVPMIFDLGDIISEFNAGSQKYFSNFNRGLYEINLSTPLDIPVFKELVNVGGGAGLPAGQYSYSIRYSNLAGDRTNFGQQTPLIPVLLSTGADSAQYPYTKTRGGESNVLAPTSFGIKLKFRVTNLLNYDSIEIRRYAWNTDSGLGSTPQPTIVARIPISNGEISVIEWTDPSDSNVEEVISDDEDTNQLSYIERAKAIRYYDKRLVLMNYTLADREMTADFIQRSGVEMFPIIEKLGKPGFNDAYFHAYKKSYMGGEEYGFAIQGYDGVAGKGFALKVPNFESYRFPNRREEVSGDSLTYSYNGAPTAANINGVVSNVFESFDLVDAVSKQDLNNFKNILNEGGKSPSDVNQDAGANYSQYGGNFNLIGNYVEGPYNPYSPTGQNDLSVSGHNYRVNSRVSQGSLSGPFPKSSYSPQGFAPNYYSKGIALNGVNNLPSWVKAFSVVRTKRADRVVAQGIGCYSLKQGDFDAGTSASKNRDKFWFFSPDILNGVVNQSVIDDITNNPSNYSLQFVSPLGFFSELYNFDNYDFLGSTDKDSCCDLITYVRALKDSGELNPDESGVGISDYVAYNKYRNSAAVNGGFFSGSDGNKLASINDFQVKTDGRSSYFEITTNFNIYNNDITGGSGNNDFVDTGMRNFTEPMYMINIVQDGKSIVDKNIDSYLSTNTYVKLESIIGEGDGTTIDPSFELVDERWEDCIPALDSGSPLASEDRFVWLDDQTGVIKAWLNVTFLTPAQLAVIVNDIVTNGFYVTSGGQNVYGVYTHTISSNQRDFNIVFNIPGFNTIDQSTRILVRYNNDAPIQVFGGDVTVGESVFAPIDRAATGGSSSTQRNKQFSFNIGFPYRHYFVTPRHYIIRNTKAITNKIQDSLDVGLPVYGTLGYVRQLLINFIAETRVATHFYYEGANLDERFFPATHYIIRPNQFSDSQFSNGATEVYKDNNIYSDYEDDYGDEYLYWQYGGFRFQGLNNINYSQESIIDSFSKPDVGFTENNEFCTGVIWSLSRAINQQDSPGLKTFISSNSYFLSDDQGEIKKAWDANGPRGENLYAFANSGTCLLLTKKSILYGANGSEIGTSEVDNFVNAELWLDKGIGMTDEFWRTHAEASIELYGEDGLSKTVEAIYFANKKSVYRMFGDQIVNIGKSNYFSELHDPLRLTLPGYQSRMAGYYDENNDVYSLQLAWQIPVVGLPPIDMEEMFAFSQKNSKFIGKFDFRFDSYVFNDNYIYGFRNGETFKLGEGYIINGNPIVSEMFQVSAPESILESEFMLINVNSNKKPTRIEFYNPNNQFMCALDQSIQGPLYLKKYDGFIQDIPRQDASISVGRDRVQDRLVMYKIIHNLEEDFSIKSSFIDYKKIK